jgi:hypothetical protein
VFAINYFDFLRRRSSAALPTTIKIPERKFGAKRASLRKEIREGNEGSQFRSGNFKLAISAKKIVTRDGKTGLSKPVVVPKVSYRTGTTT